MKKAITSLEIEIPKMKVPCPAKYIPGRQKNSIILVDPEGFYMSFKKKKPSGLFYYDNTLLQD